MTATPGTLARKAQENQPVPLAYLCDLMTQTARLDDDALDNGIRAVLDSANTGAINAQEAQLLLQHLVHAWASAWVDTEIAELLSKVFGPSGTYHRSWSSPHPKGQRQTARYPVRWR